MISYELSEKKGPRCMTYWLILSHMYFICLFLLIFFLIGEIFQTRCGRSCIYFTISSGWCQKCYDAKHWKSSRPRRKTRKLDRQNRRIRGQCKFSHFHNSIIVLLKNSKTDSVSMNKVCVWLRIIVYLKWDQYFPWNLISGSGKWLIPVIVEAHKML